MVLSVWRLSRGPFLHRECVQYGREPTYTTLKLFFLLLCIARLRHDGGEVRETKQHITLVSVTPNY